MKKVFLAVLLVVSFTTFAQERKGNKEARENKSPEEKVEMRIAKMTKDLGLNEKQASQIKALMSQKMEERKEKMEDRKAQMQARKKEMESKRAEFDAKLKSILNADQYAKWQEKQSENKEKMKEKRGERKGAK